MTYRFDLPAPLRRLFIFTLTFVSFASGALEIPKFVCGDHLTPSREKIERLRSYGAQIKASQDKALTILQEIARLQSSASAGNQLIGKIVGEDIDILQIGANPKVPTSYHINRIIWDSPRGWVLVCQPLQTSLLEPEEQQIPIVDIAHAVFIRRLSNGQITDIRRQIREAMTSHQAIAFISYTQGTNPQVQVGYPVRRRDDPNEDHFLLKHRPNDTSGRVFHIGNVEPESLFSFLPTEAAIDAQLNVKLEKIRWAMRNHEYIQFFTYSPGFTYHSGEPVSVDLDPAGDYEVIMEERFVDQHKEHFQRNYYRVPDIQLLKNQQEFGGNIDVAGLIKEAVDETKGVAFEVSDYSKPDYQSHLVNEYHSQLFQPSHIVQGRAVAVRSGVAVVELDGGDFVTVQLNKIVPTSLETYDIFPIPLSEENQKLRVALLTARNRQMTVEFKKSDVSRPLAGKIEDVHTGSDLMPWVKVDISPRHNNFFLPLAEITSAHWSVHSPNEGHLVIEWEASHVQR